MKAVKTEIIPVKSTFARVVNEKHEPDLKAICIFMATGFFLDQDTYWRDKVVLRPGTVNQISEEGDLRNSSTWFEWYYQPKEIEFKEALARFKGLFEEVVDKQTKNKNLILPLSGGLDSRSLALALYKLDREVQSYSYSFEGGFQESGIAKNVAEACGFPFREYEIPPGYLWEVIEDLAQLNRCYSEFTHPRQMALYSEFQKMNGTVILGHWGDVLFDRGIAENERTSDTHKLILKKIIKKGGMELADSLWKAWGLEGRFQDYLSDRVLSLLNKIDIKNHSAKVRAFKSLYWASRWTSTNLAIFAEAGEITLPYYSDEMCKFICEIPESFLADRRLQIEYIRQEPRLSKIPWERHKPFNLQNYGYNKVPYNLPYRILSRLRREMNSLGGKKYIQRNWELQFLGENNDRELNRRLFNKSFTDFIPENLISSFYNNFRENDEVHYSHPVSMLLTLSLWNKKFNDA